MLLKLGVALFIIGFCLVEARGWQKDGKQRRKHKFGNMTDDQVKGFKNSLRKTNVDRFVAALDRLADKNGTDIEPSANEKAAMKERIKHLRKHVRSPKIHEDGDDMTEVNEKAGVAESLYQGDMALDDSQVDAILGEFVDGPADARKKRQAFYNSRYPRNLWGNTFYYYFDPSLTDEAKAISQVAIAFWQNSTCVNFEENSTAPNRVRFFKGQGCYSYVGMIGGEQDLSLGSGCQYFRQAAHEIAHALGFFHEQSRYDRDTAITVNTENVKPESVGNYRETETRNNNYNMPYDYGSIMQYADTSFTANGGKTMISKVPVYQDNMGSQSVSFYDISMMNEHYQCKQKCTSGATCVNGGFRNSRNCNTCICPSGYGGATCSDRAPGCGATLTATSATQTLNITIGVRTSVDYPTFETCNYLIKAPASNKVEVVLRAIAGNVQCRAGCIYKGIEVKATNDHRYTGIRYCCSDDVGTTIVSEGNIVPVIAFNRYHQSNYTVTYRSVPSSTASTILAIQLPMSKPTL
ncbi:unnamed protein product, partial [Mesorhabditis belari]|uniref:Zinc metalloproteinase n=1 Tax=Mesorhabditis belari TaxID=2138241 RepID=A0AAF3FKX0_9BILA